MHIETFPVGPFSTNTYIIRGKSGLIVVDPSWEDDELSAFCAENGALSAFLFTHNHIDHIAGYPSLEGFSSPDCSIVMHDSDFEHINDGAYTGGLVFGYPSPQIPVNIILKGSESVFEVDGIKFRFIHTPGHTPGSVCYEIVGEKMLLTGDTLFAGGIGRTDLPGGDRTAIVHSLRLLVSLNTDLAIFPGHGPSSSIGAERFSVQNFCREYS